MSSERAQRTEATSSSSGTATSTLGRLRNDLTSASSEEVATTSVGVSLPQLSSSCRAFFVDGSSNAEPLTSATVPAEA